MEKNLKWAQENNSLTNQLIETEKNLIDAKLQIANLASVNDRIKFTLNEKNKDIKRLNSYIKKHKIEKEQKSKIITEGTESST